MRFPVPISFPADSNYPCCTFLHGSYFWAHRYRSDPRKNYPPLPQWRSPERRVVPFFRKDEIGVSQVEWIIPFAGHHHPDDRRFKDKATGRIKMKPAVKSEEHTSEHHFIGH